MGISTKFTHADLLLMPDDLKRREIIDGDMFTTPSPTWRHQLISGNILFAFLRHLEVHSVGIAVTHLDVILSDYDVVEPDLLFILNEHRNVIQDWIRGAPDLVIEILSPITEATDRGPKLKVYARFGIPEYWIVDPEKNAIEVYRLEERTYRLAQIVQGQETLTSPLLPEFALEVGEVFAPY